jgi:hypothetical protein
MSSAPQPAPESRIELQPLPFVQSITTPTVGITPGENTRYIGFAPPVDQLRIQVSHAHGEDEDA